MHSDSKTIQTDNKAVIPLRPHHGMCLAYFEGRGYSEGFSAHMGRMLEILEAGATVQLVVGTDRICRACPNNCAGICLEAERVQGFDEGVLEYCELRAGEILSFGAFARQVQERILGPGKRPEICGGCGWEEICLGKRSRWEEGEG